MANPLHTILALVLTTAPLPAPNMPAHFLQVVGTVGVTGVVLWLCARWIQKLMPGVK